MAFDALRLSDILMEQPG